MNGTFPSDPGVPGADVPDLDLLGDEFEAPPCWVEDVVRAIGATFPARNKVEADPLGEAHAPLGDVPLDLDDQDGNVEVPEGRDADGEDADPHAVLEDMAREVERMEAEDLADAPATVTVASTWAEVAELRPRWVVQLVEALLRNHHLRRDLVDQVEGRMLRGVPPEHRDPALVQAAWDFAGHPSRRAETSRWLRRIRNASVSVLHRGNAFQHHVPTAHPENMRGWRPKGGVLVVNEVASGSASFGHPALLEHTPVKVVYYALKTWQMGQGIVFDVEDVDPDGGLVFPVPTVLDPTAGSGTVPDYIGCLQGSGGKSGRDDAPTLHGAGDASFDVTPMSERVRPLDLRDLLLPASVRDIAWLPRLHENDKWTPVLTVPPVDLVFFDPPSRGTPTHSELYAGARPEADLGGFHRDDYIAACSAFIRMAVNVLKPGGYIVYLIRHGVRDRQRIVEDNRLVVDLKVAMGPCVTVERQIPIKYKKRIPQNSLGVERVPATLLMLRRST